MVTVQPRVNLFFFFNNMKYIYIYIFFFFPTSARYRILPLSFHCSGFYSPQNSNKTLSNSTSNREVYKEMTIQEM